MRTEILILIGGLLVIAGLGFLFYVLKLLESDESQEPELEDSEEEEEVPEEEEPGKVIDIQNIPEPEDNQAS